VPNAQVAAVVFLFVVCYLFSQKVEMMMKSENDVNVWVFEEWEGKSEGKGREKGIGEGSWVDKGGDGEEVSERKGRKHKRLEEKK